jgi:hypothetical protein
MRIPRAIACAVVAVAVVVMVIGTLAPVGPFARGAAGGADAPMPPPAPPAIRVGLIGNPNTVPEWTDQRVKALKDAGFTAVQLNVAWGSRPQNEPLNLNDVVGLPGEPLHPQVAKRQPELRKRIDLAKKYGLRTIFHFGSPFMWRAPDTGQIKRHSGDAFRGVWFDSANPKVVEYETGLLKQFVERFGDVDDILVYTYDQDAWEASQFSTSKFSRAVPLHERLPKYLAKLHEIWTQRAAPPGAADADRQVHRMWWEPWELSAGQVYKIIPQLPTKNFGLSIHSNIAEAQISKPVDLWYRTTARLCRERGIPVIGEGYFCAETEEVQSMAIPCPRLVDEEYLRMTAVPGIVGVKEYFGVLPLQPDLNLAMFTARLNHPDATTDQLLDQVTARFGKQQPRVKKLCAELSDAMQMMPFEASWFVRLISQASIDHGWSAAYIHGQMADTPSWNSTRHALFMKTDDRQPHPDMLEDVQLRCELAADHMNAALELLPDLVSATSGPDRAMFERLSKELDHFRRVATSYALHLRETQLAKILRDDLDAKRPMTPRAVEEMKTLLDADIENQHGKGRVVQMRDEFKAAPEKFVREHLLPTDKTVLERGHFTLTTR